MGTGWVAVWVPNGPITREEMAEFGKPAIEAAYAQEAVTVTFALADGRLITMNRLLLILPVFIESPDWREAQDFQNALEERAERGRMN